MASKKLKWPHPCKHTPKRFLEALTLDIMSIPGLFMSDEANAKWHLKHVCPHCSQHRKSFRDPKEKGDFCLWEDAWKRGHYVEYPRNFGIKAWILYYLGVRTNMRRFYNLYKKLLKQPKTIKRKVHFMYIKDKIILKDTKKRCCPAHYWPHKIPDGKPITDKPCHTHKKTWRKAHHNFYCKFIKCPHYKFMKEKTKSIPEE